MLAAHDTASADGGRVQVHVWGLNLDEPRFGWYAVVDAFERQYPGVEIVFGPTDRGQDLQKLLSGVVGSAPPDVFLRETQLFGDIAARGILLPLDKFVASDKSRPDGVHEDDYLPGMWESGRYAGKLYAIADSANPLVLAYDKKVFRDAGLDPDRPPRTWDDWRDTTQKLTSRDKNGRVTRLGLAFHQRDDLAFYMAQLGKDAFSDNGHTCALDSLEGLQALRFMKSLYDAQGGRNAYDQFVSSNNGPEEFSPFGRGKIAMSVEDDWVLFRAMRFAPDMELGIVPVPAPAGRKPITRSNTNGLFMIPANARQPNEAWDFLRFIHSPQGQLIKAAAQDAYARSKGRRIGYTGLQPNREVAAALSAEYPFENPRFLDGFEQCRKILECMVPVCVSPVSGPQRDEMLRAVERAGYGQTTPENALADAARRIQEQLDLFYGREALPLFQWKYAWGALALLIVGGIALLWGAARRDKTRTGPGSRLQRREDGMGLVFISPWVIGVLLFTVGPMVFSMAMSFCDYDVLHPARYVGLRNYQSLLGRDPLFWKSMANTAYMAAALPLGMAVSLGIALLLNAKVKAMSLYRTVFYLPAITPTVAAAVLWYALLNPDGLINAALNATIGEWFGVRAPAWLQDPAWSKPAIVLMGLWGAGGGMILWLAGLQGIPEHLYEAASIDGAGCLRRFWSITLPMLTPYIFFSLVVGVIGVFQIFGQALILTQGGPADTTLFYVYYLFNNAFRYFKMGYASAQAWILFVIVLVLTLLQWRSSRKWVHYG